MKIPFTWRTLSLFLATCALSVLASTAPAQTVSARDRDAADDPVLARALVLLAARTGGH